MYMFPLSNLSLATSIFYDRYEIEFMVPICLEILDRRFLFRDMY